MSDHRAEQILSAVVDTVTGLTTTGTDVRRARVFPWGEDTEYALAVYQGANSPAAEPNVAYQDAEIVVRIEHYARTNLEQIDSALNRMAAEVYVAMLTDRTLGLAFVIDTIWQGDGEIDLSGDGAMIAARRVSEYAVRYRHAYSNPTQ